MVLSWVCTAVGSRPAHTGVNDYVILRHHLVIRNEETCVAGVGGGGGHRNARHPFLARVALNCPPTYPQPAAWSKHLLPKHADRGSAVSPDMSRGYTASGHAPPPPPANLICRSQRPGQGMGTLCLRWSSLRSCHPNTCPLVPYCTSRRRPGTASTNSWSMSITGLGGGGRPPPPGGR
jgi:hypothetical protein